MGLRILLLLTALFFDSTFCPADPLPQYDPNHWYRELVKLKKEGGDVERAEFLFSDWALFPGVFNGRAENFLRTIAPTRLPVLSDGVLTVLFTKAPPSTTLSLAALPAKEQKRLAVLWAAAKADATSRQIRSAAITRNKLAYTGFYGLSLLATAGVTWLTGHPYWALGAGGLAMSSPLLSRATVAIPNGWRSSMEATTAALQAVEEYKGEVTPLLLENVERMLRNMNGSGLLADRDRVREPSRRYGLTGHFQQMVPDYLTLAEAILSAIEPQRIPQATDAAASERAQRLYDLRSQLHYSLGGIAEWASRNGHQEEAQRARALQAKATTGIGSMYTIVPAAAPPPSADGVKLDRDGVPIEWVPPRKLPRELRFLRQREDADGGPITITEEEQGDLMICRVPDAIYRKLGVVDGKAAPEKVSQEFGAGVWTSSSLVPGKYFYVPQLKPMTPPDDVTIEVWAAPWKDRKALTTVTRDKPYRRMTARPGFVQRCLAGAGRLWRRPK